MILYRMRKEIKPDGTEITEHYWSPIITLFVGTICGILIYITYKTPDIVTYLRSISPYVTK